jgi:meso-butanediol dehydrogenase / (S,S)-butanediol dehydrogenase / diacetyl reductase
VAPCDAGRRGGAHRAAPVIGQQRLGVAPKLKGFSTAEDVAEAVVLALPRDRSRIVSIVMRPMNEAT